MPYPIIIFIKHYLPYSETFVYRQLKALSPEFEASVLAVNEINLDKFPHTPSYFCPPNCFEYVVEGVLRLIGNFEFVPPSQYKCWKNLLVSTRPALIHAHFGSYGLKILPVAKELKIPLLVTFHGFDASKLLRIQRYRQSLRSLFDYAHIIAVSQSMRERLLRFGANPDRSFHHYIGIPVENFPYIKRKSIAEKVRNNEQVIFLQTARFSRKKGQRYTIQAFAKLLSFYPNSLLILAGDGEEYKYCQQLCQTLTISEKVQFLGAVSSDKVSQLMEHADVFLQHSITTEDGDEEGLPIGLLEAMSRGLVVVSTFHAGIPEAITNGINGYLVPEKAIAEYVLALKQVLRTNGEMGRVASNTVHETFNLTLQNVKLKQIYEKVISEHRS